MIRINNSKKVIFLLLLLCIALISGSFAIWNNGDKSEGNVIHTGVLTIAFEGNFVSGNNKTYIDVSNLQRSNFEITENIITNDLNAENFNLSSNKVAIGSFNIKNNGNETKNIKISFLENSGDVNLKQYLKCALFDSRNNQPIANFYNVTLANIIANTSGTISDIAALQTLEYKLYVWLPIDSPINASNSTYKFDIDVSIVSEDTSTYQIINGNFNNGTLDGWTILEGTAFSNNRISNETTFWNNGTDETLTANRKFNSEGEYFFRGFKAGNEETEIEQKTGSMKSSIFTLGGTGYISFLIGGSKHSEIYVALCNANDDTELCTIDNSQYFVDPAMSENLHRVFWNVSDYLGNKVYLKIVDNWNNTDFGSINLDDFQTYLTGDALIELYNNYASEIENLNDFDEVKTAMRNAFNNQSIDLAGNAPIIESVPNGITILPSETANLSYLLTSVVASDDFTSSANLNKSIISVIFNGVTDTNGDFSSYDMSAEGLYTINFVVKDSFQQSTSGSFILNVQNSSMSDTFINTTTDLNEQNALLSIKFDEGNGKIVNDCSNKNLGTTEISNYYSTTYRPSEVLPVWTERSAVSGKSLSFDCLNNSFSYPSNSISILGNKLTVDVFVAPRNYVWSNTNDAIENWLTHIICGQYTDNAGFKVGMTKYGYWTFQVYIEGVGWRKLYNDRNNSSTKLDTYKWNHLTCVFDGENGEMIIYKNGIQVNMLSGTYGNIKNANVDFIVGRGCIKVDNGVSEYDMSHFNGLMDELKIYNIAKTSAKILLFHNNFTDGNFMKTVIYDDARLQDIFTAEDYYRPQYHANPPNHWMNEPHALFKFNDKWHLFYQANSYGPFWQGGITWGHLVSDDMITWNHVKDAVVPVEGSVINDGAWSGNMAFNSDGIPYLFITAGNDKRIDVDGTTLASNQNIAIAYPVNPNDPLLEEWIVADSLSVEQGDLPVESRGVLSEFRDPQIFEEDGIYYMVICGRSTDSKPIIHLYTTDNGCFYTENNGIKNYKVWTYRGNILPQTFYNNYQSKFGKSAELPNLSPIYSEDGLTKKYILCFAPSPNESGIDIGSYYWIGELNKTTYSFIPDINGAPKVVDTCYKAFSGGTIYFDKESKKTYIIGLIQDDRNTMERKNSGWAHCASMIREIYLRNDGTLGIKSAADYDEIIDNTKTNISLTNADVSTVNERINSISNDMIRIKFKIKANGSNDFGFKLKMEGANDYVILGYNEGTIGITKSTYIPNVSVGIENTKDTNNIFNLYNDYLEGIIYIDHSMIEGFFNEKAVISSMVYNKGNNLEVFGENITFEYFVIDYLTI